MALFVRMPIYVCCMILADFLIHSNVIIVWFSEIYSIFFLFVFNRHFSLYASNFFLGYLWGPRYTNIHLIWLSNLMNDWHSPSNVGTGVYLYKKEKKTNESSLSLSPIHSQFWWKEKRPKVKEKYIPTIQQTKSTVRMMCQNAIFICVCECVQWAKNNVCACIFRYILLVWNNMVDGRY